MVGSISSAFIAQPRASLKRSRSNSALARIVITSAAFGSASTTGVHALITALYLPWPSLYALRHAVRSGSVSADAAAGAGAAGAAATGGAFGSAGAPGSATGGGAGGGVGAAAAGAGVGAADGVGAGG